MSRGTKFAPSVPVEADLHDFPCTDYLDSEYAASGRWDEAGQIWTILARSEVEVDKEHKFLVVGHPGVDGVLFGYRKHHAGVWAYHPMAAEFQWLAPDIHRFIEGWENGTITL